MGTACSKDENREANRERRRKREEELGVTPRNVEVDDGRSALMQSTLAYPSPSMPPTPVNAFYDPFAASIAAQQRQFLGQSYDNRPPLAPTYHSNTLFPTHMPPPAPHSGLPTPINQPHPPSRGPRKASNRTTPKNLGTTHTYYGGGSVTPRSRRGSDPGRQMASRSKSTAQSAPYTAGDYGISSIGLRPQVVQALGMLETEEIQQRLDIQAAEREGAISIALLYEWLPEACAVQNMLREIVDLERMSRVAILRQESASMDAFVAWTRELLEDSRLTMYVSRTLQRQHIPSPPRGRGISPMRGANGIDLSVKSYGQPAGAVVTHNAPSTSYRHPSPLVFRSGAPPVPTSRPHTSPRKVSPVHHRRQSSIHDLPEDTVFFSTREGKALGPAGRSVGQTENKRASPPSPPTHRYQGTSNTTDAAIAQNAPSSLLPCSAGDPRFLCYHPPHALDMQQRRAASEERARKAKQEHDEITRLAALGSQMYGREEEELMAKIARQNALADHSKGLYKAAPSRAAPPPPSEVGGNVSALRRLPPADASGLNSPPRSTVAASTSEPVPWYMPSPNPHLRPHPTGPNYNNSTNPNDFSYISGSAAADFSTLNVSALGTMDNNKWQRARDASARATRSRLSALNREY